MVWLILLVAFGLMPTLLAGAKKAAASRGIGADDSDEHMEADDSEDDSFFSFDEDETEKAAAQQPNYFTYEDLNTDVPPVRPKAQRTVVMPVEEEQPTSPAFDLRQAVLYQTLLNNKYINAEN